MTPLHDRIKLHLEAYFAMNGLESNHIEPLAQHLAGNLEPLLEGSVDPRLVRLVKAAADALEWLDRFGEHAPIQFGGEADVVEKLLEGILPYRALLEVAAPDGITSTKGDS